MILFFILTVVIFIITLLFLLICLSTLEIEIKKLDNYNENKKIKIIAYIRLKLFNRITWTKIRFDNNKIEKIKKYNLTKKGLDKFNIIKHKIFKKENIKYIKYLDIKIQEIDLILKVGAINPIVTSFVVTIISTFLSILFSKNIEENWEETCRYIIKPIYVEKPRIIIKLNCIINVKMVHIINIIYTLLRKIRSEYKNERTSNRRTYAYCNGKHSRYGRC